MTSKLRREGRLAYFPDATEWDRDQLNPYLNRGSATASDWRRLDMERKSSLWVQGWQDAEEKFIRNKRGKGVFAVLDDELNAYGPDEEFIICLSLGRI